MKTENELIQISKTMSHALRHEPWLYELELDDQGWVPIADLLTVLRLQRKNWRDLSVDDLNLIIKDSSKQRHEINGDKIRALYGHSTPEKLLKIASTPPDVLYHGTSQRIAEIIVEEGIK